METTPSRKRPKRLVVQLLLTLYHKMILLSIIVICIFCAAFTILRGYDYYNGVMVVTMGPENNPNTLGALMVFGIALMMFRNKRRIMDLVVLLFFMLVFSYVIILTGSKKSLLSILVPF